MKRWFRFICMVVVVTALGAADMGDIAQGAAAPARIDGAFLKEAGSGTANRMVIIHLDGQPLVDRVPDPGTAGWLKTTAACSAAADIEKEQDRFLLSLATQNIPYHVLERFSITYDGLALNVPGNDLAAVAAASSVSFVYASRTAVTLDDTSDTAMGVDQALWNTTAAGGTKLDGSGTTIGIIDTGIDYTHPDLGGGSFPNAKVVGGYDFGDNDADPMDTNGHGTHVAGIAAADGKVRGVAPKAKLYAYKVFSSREDGATDAAIIAALDRSVQDHCTVVNMSLGISGGTADTPENDAINNAVKAGVIVVAAAGNSGPRNPDLAWPLGSPATALNAIAVAASNDGPYPVVKVTAPDGVTVDPITGSYADLAPEFTEGSTYDVVDAGYGSTADFAAVNVKGRVALVERGPIGTGGIYFRDKVLNAEAAGAAGVIIYNHSPGVLGMTLQVAAGDENRTYIPCIGITEDDGQELRALAARGLRVQFSTQSHLGTMADFSSMGPTADFHFKPEVSAPGVTVNSTLPGDSYAKLDGTSMASPAVAGAVALLKAAHPSWTAQTVKLALMNTADVLRNWQNNEVITWTLQGAGRVDVPAAIAAPATAGVTTTDGTVSVQTGALLIDDSSAASASTVTLQNLTGSPVTFAPSFAWTLQETAGVSVHTAPSSVTLAAGGTATVEVTTSLAAATVQDGAHEGVLTFTSSRGALHVPYVYWHGPVEVPQQLSGLHLDSTTLAPLSTSADVGFTIGYGGVRPAVDQNEEPQGSSFASQVTATVTGTDGTAIGTIYSRSLLLVGDHQFVWDGRDVHGNLFLPDGSYLLRTSIWEGNNDGSNLQVTETAHQEVPFQITGMEQAATLALNVASGSLQQGGEMEVSLLASGAVTTSEATATLHYDPYLLAVQSVQEGTFLNGDQAGVSTLTSQTDPAAGTVMIHAVRKTGTVTGRGTICTIRFTVLHSGSTELWLEHPVVQSSTGAVAVLAPSLPLTLRDDARPWDINGDGTVDATDLVLLARAYGTTAGDVRYNAGADINGDGKIDETDLRSLQDHFGETYP